ncbi:hypothetical protein QE410_003381 [Microbacterium sp. SORGH_AS 1204]|uniref:hypothetical protein n=1 Tax=Microbacterium sp. SORGH_AS_1204 TaxID=3041785 RepID=UPI00278D5FE7|nr:hypothetical protein [Microbacterium sp. SORGH_AS_1204]MDQ1138582.1 hypothetical protein [Microbacterium sp. SORGH_AS_1204]
MAGDAEDGDVTGGGDVTAGGRWGGIRPPFLPRPPLVTPSPSARHALAPADADAETRLLCTLGFWKP